MYQKIKEFLAKYPIASFMVTGVMIFGIIGLVARYHGN